MAKPTKEKSVQEEVKAVEKGNKFKFESTKGFFYVDIVKAQFIDGKFETDSEEVAKVLRVIEEVKEVK